MNPIEAGYQTVAVRLAQFVKDHPDGLILTRMETILYNEGAGIVVMSADVWKDREDADNDRLPDGRGFDSMVIPGTTNFTNGSEVANTETSAVGRALAMIGYLAKNEDGTERMASNDEIEMKGGTTKPTRKRKITPKSDKVNIGRLSEVLARGKALHGGDSKALGEFVKTATGVSKKEELTNEQLDMLEDLFKVKEAEDAGE